MTLHIVDSVLGVAMESTLLLFPPKSDGWGVPAVPLRHHRTRVTHMPNLEGLRARITADFSLEHFPPEQRQRALASLLRTTLKGVIIHAGDKDLLADETAVSVLQALQQTEQEHTVLEDPFQYALNALVQGIPEFDAILTEAIGALKTQLSTPSDPARKEVVEAADGAEELLGALATEATDILDAFGKGGAFIGLVATAIDLLFDPARSVRSTSEQQLRLARKLGDIATDALIGIWTGLLLLTFGAMIERYGPFKSFGAQLKGVGPDWYVTLSLGKQALTLFGLALLVLVLGVAAHLVAHAIFTSSWARKHLFRPLALDPLDRATTGLRGHLEPLFSGLERGRFEALVRDSAKAVYSTILVERAKWGARTKRNATLLAEFRARPRWSEDAVVRFLKPRVRRYRSVLLQEIERFAADSRGFMRSVFGDEYPPYHPPVGSSRVARPKWSKRLLVFSSLILSLAIVVIVLFPRLAARPLAPRPAPTSVPTVSSSARRQRPMASTKERQAVLDALYMDACSGANQRHEFRPPDRLEIILPLRNDCWAGFIQARGESISYEAIGPVEVLYSFTDRNGLAMDPDGSYVTKEEEDSPAKQGLVATDPRRLERWPAEGHIRLKVGVLYMRSVGRESSQVVMKLMKEQTMGRER